jgi:hypothetical protein
MSVFSNGWPWLRKPKAIRHSVRMISDSATAARGLLGYLDEAEGEPLWRPPRSEHVLGGLDVDRPFGAPEDTLARGLSYLAQHRRDLPAGTFVFVLSDFLVMPSRDDWLRAIERRWEIVPVVIQDPVWEQSFPDVSGAAVRFVDARTGRPALAALRAREVAERRVENERRREALLRSLQGLDLEPLLVSSHEHQAVSSAFLGWADQRLFTRGRA